MNDVDRYLTTLAEQVSDWDTSVIRQAVLVTAYLKPSGRVSANDFRDVLPDVAHWAVGAVIRQLPTKKHGALIEKARTVDGYPITEPSTAESTHGKPLQVWRLTAAGRAVARDLYEGRVAA